MKAIVSMQRKVINLSYRKLAYKMWTKFPYGHSLEISHQGNSSILRTYFSIGLKLDKGLNDKRWYEREFSPLNVEDMEVNPLKNGSALFFQTGHVSVLPVDERAFCIFVLEIAKKVNGKISEDGGKTWMLQKTFRKKHADVLAMTFGEAMDKSLQLVGKIPVKEEKDCDAVVYL